MAPGAVVVQPTEDKNRGVLSTHLHSDGNDAEILAIRNPGTHANHWIKGLADYEDAEIGQQFVSHAMIDNGQNLAYMEGQEVFKRAVVKFPEVVMEALTANGYQPSDIKVLIPHQANLRISQFVQKN